MNDLISRQAAIDAFVKYVADGYAESPDDFDGYIGIIKTLPSAQPDLQPTCNQLATDYISRQAAIAKFEQWLKVEGYSEGELNMLKAVLYELRSLPSAEPDVPDIYVGDMISRQAAIEWLTTEWDGMVTSVFDGIKRLPSAESQWISVKEKLPKDNVPVNITWVNRHPEPYYKSIKDVPFTATGVYFKGKWYWYSQTVEDYLAEYGRAEWDEIEETMAGCIEVTAWMPLPEPYKEGRTDEVD